MDPSVFLDPNTIFTFVIFFFGIYFFNMMMRRMPSSRDISAPPRSSEKPEDLLRQLGPEVGRFADYLEPLSNLEGERKALVEAGLEQRRGSNFAAAARSFQECLEQDGSPLQEVALHLLIGHCQVGERKRDESLGHFQTALEIAEESGNALGRIFALRNIGLHYEAQGDVRRAQENIEEALALSQSGGRRQDQVTDLGNLARLHLRRNDQAKSLEYARQALILHSGDDLRLDRACALGNLGVVYRAQGNAKRAQEHLEKALTLSRESGFKAGEAAALGNLGFLSSDLGDLKKALKYHQDALSIFEEIKAQDQVAATRETIEELRRSTESQSGDQLGQN